MVPYLPEQIALVVDAVREGRAALQEAGVDDPLVFARAYVEHNGIQIPGKPNDHERSQEIAAKLMHALGRGLDDPDDDADVAREMHRVRTETRIALHLEVRSVIGFLLELGSASTMDVACLELLAEDCGLGAAVFPKARVVVPPPWCLDYDFTPIREDEVEQ